MILKRSKKNKFIYVVIFGLVLFVVLEVLFLISQTTLAKKDPSSSALSIKQECGKLVNKEQCYAKAFYLLTKIHPLEYSEEVLNILQKEDPQNALGCHFIAHKISQAESEKDPTKWKEIIKRVNFYSCTGGFLHGIIEAHLSQDPDFKINKESADLICNRLVNDNSGGERSCNHGMGHLMLAQYNGDIKKAVKECNEFPQGMQRYECLSGAFMENLTREYLIAHGIAARLPWTLENSKKIEKLCGEFSGDAQRACWKEISYMYWSIYDTDQKKLYEACEQAPEREMVDECFIYGAGNMTTSYKFSKSRLPEVCNVYEVDSDKYKNCTWQLVGAMVNTSLQNIPDIINLCSSISEESSIFCYERLLTTLFNNKVDTKYITQVCKSAPRELFKNTCANI